MILRKLAEAIRKQDWFVVVLEILIVVIGIYIGLQVDDWNQRRQERGLLDDYMERLYAEVVSNIEVYEVEIALWRSASDLFIAYHDHILDKSKPMPDTEALSAHLCRNGVMGLPIYDNSLLSG